MKTIEEVSKEFSEKSVWACPISFKAGVEFAQRWISVEDELPKEPTFLIAKKLNGLVLGLFYNANKDFMYGEVKQTSQVTHWRPIELK